MRKVRISDNVYADKVLITTAVIRLCVNDARCHKKLSREESEIFRYHKSLTRYCNLTVK